MRMQGLWAGFAAAVILLGAPAVAGAQVLRCNMTSPCGAAPAPGCAGCTTPGFVWHANANPCEPTAANGSFNLIGTQYENTCALGNGCTIGQPNLRFWQFDNFAKANNGCQAQDVSGLWWLINSFPDDGTGGVPGHWYMYQANWAGGLVDGCYNFPGAPAARTVAEISDVLASAEGTPSHSSWYVIGAVTPSNDFTFDDILGGTGCTPAEIVQQPVRGVTIDRRTGPCIGGTVPTEFGPRTDLNPLAGFFDVDVTLVDPSPDWWTEGGLNGAPQLIEGYQILYTTTAPTVPPTEPTSSDLVTGGWLPVYSASDLTAPKFAKGVVALGTATTRISLPIPGSPSPHFWLATRIVYRDASENPGAEFDPATGTPGSPVGPQITTPVSGHCGPLVFVATAVQFGSLEAVRTSAGVRVRWTTLSEADTSGFRVIRSADEAGIEAAVDVAPFVEARGASHEYEEIDASAAPNATYYYTVQELTSNGLGDRSEAARVGPEAGVSATRGASSGGRLRGKHR